MATKKGALEALKRVERAIRKAGLDARLEVGGVNATITLELEGLVSVKLLTEGLQPSGWQVLVPEELLD